MAGSSLSAVECQFLGRARFLAFLNPEPGVLGGTVTAEPNILQPYPANPHVLDPASKHRSSTQALLGISPLRPCRFHPTADRLLLALPIILRANGPSPAPSRHAPVIAESFEERQLL